MNGIETGIRCGERNERSSCVSVHLSTLALSARASPLANVGVYARPHIAGSDELLSCSNGWMRHLVERVENALSKIYWHTLTCRTGEGWVMMEVE